MAESVSIVGATGALGFALTVQLGRAGTPIVLGSRSTERAVEAAGRATQAVPSGSFEGLDNAGAAAASEIVMVCVPFRTQSETLTNLKHVLVPGQIVVDATAPLAAAVGGKATRVLGVWQGSAAQQAQEMVPDGVRVISALHTVGAAALGELDKAQREEDVLVCGDRKEDKLRVMELINRIDHLRCVDCGLLDMARITEQMTALLIGINVRYKVHAGIRIAGLPDAKLQP